MTLPKEIRDRVIVVAIAPAAIIPDGICFKSVNYACKGDPVPLGEMVFAGLLSSHETGSSLFEESVQRHHTKLILLDKIPGSGSRHDLQQAAFREPMENHIKEYIGRNGIY